MVSLLPAVLIGGPPHAGKSVLTYSLTQALRQHDIEHYVIRACPDGEGDWSQEINQDMVRLIRIKGTWSDAFLQRISSDLERRHLPLLVDAGGLPTEEQTRIFRHCTHSILLLHAHDQSSAQSWQHIVKINSLLPVALLYSELTGPSMLTSERPIIEGTLTGLGRSKLASGPVFDLLVERLVSLFVYSHEELEKVKLDLAPTELAARVEQLLKSIVPQSRQWTPEMLPRLYDELPTGVPLSVYGRGPGWLYGALVVLAGSQPFYQFDPRLGWVAPPPLRLSADISPEVTVKTREREDATVLSVHIGSKHLDYLQAEYLPFPPVSLEQGLILDGAMPHWLLTALARLYHGAGAAWIACHQPPLQGAIVIASRTGDHAIGDLIPMP